MSYSRTDAIAARRVQRKLESYVLPKRVRVEGISHKSDRRLLRPIFRDDDELVPGGLLPQRIGAALASSDFLIVLCSRAAAKSEWVDREIATFKALGRADQLIAIVIDGEPNAEKGGLSPELECLPPSLRGLEGGPNLSADAEHFWVDWRRSNSSDRRPFIQLVAALLQLESVDDLLQRDRQAKMRKRTLLGVYAAFGLLATTAAVAALWWLSLSSDRAQYNRLTLHMNKAWQSQLAETRGDGPNYSVILSGDLNNDGVIDYVINDRSFFSCSSEGCNDRILIGNISGGFNDLLLQELFFKYQTRLELSGNTSGWQEIIGIMHTNSPDFYPVLAISKYDESINTYQPGAWILCGPAANCGWLEESENIAFCPLTVESKRYIEVNFTSDARYIAPFEGGRTDWVRTRSPLNPKQYESKYGMVPIALSTDGRWLMFADIVMPGPVYAEWDRPASPPELPKICAATLGLERSSTNNTDKIAVR